MPASRWHQRLRTMRARCCLPALAVVKKGFSEIIPRLRVDATTHLFLLFSRTDMAFNANFTVRRSGTASFNPSSFFLNVSCLVSFEPRDTWF